MKPPFPTVLIGCGQVAAGWSQDFYYAKWYRYATHAQVLADHPHFQWVAAVDPDHAARVTVSKHWPKVTVAGSLGELPADKAAPTVVVIATPPSLRLAILEELPSSVRALIVEKPLGLTVAECEAFLSMCRQRNVLVQVNLWRRADELHRQLTGDGLRKHIGDLQGISIVYTGGLVATAVHLIDWIDMAAGPIVTVQAHGGSALLTTGAGVTATLLALDGRHFREVTIDVWGTTGRLTIANEALVVTVRGVSKHRAMAGDKEIAADSSGERIQPTVGEAYYHLYTNLAQALQNNTPLLAEGQLALRAASVIEAIATSAADDGRAIRV